MSFWRQSLTNLPSGGEAEALTASCPVLVEENRDLVTDSARRRDRMTKADDYWTMENIIKGVKDAAAFCDCNNHPEAPTWSGACRLAALELERLQAKARSRNNPQSASHGPPEERREYVLPASASHGAR